MYIVCIERVFVILSTRLTRAGYGSDVGRRGVGDVTRDLSNHRELETWEARQNKQKKLREYTLPYSRDCLLLYLIYR